jgi:hypothetical protein
MDLIGNKQNNNDNDLRPAYNVLGCNIKLNSNDSAEGVDARDIVALVEEEARGIREKFPRLTEQNISVLVALQLAQKNLSLKAEFKDNITSLKRSAVDALQYIDEITPSQN